MYNYFTIKGIRTSSLFDLKKDLNDIIFELTEKDFKEIKPKPIFVADPHVIKKGNGYELYCELLIHDEKHKKTIKGVIVKIEKTSLHSKWTNPQVVIEEYFHLSYPQIHILNNEYYMTVESAEKNQIRVYKAMSGTNDWVFHKTLLTGTHYDPTFLKHNGKWFLFSCTEKNSNILKLYTSDNFFKNWSEHPKNPICFNSKISRPAGPIMKFNNKLYRISQDCSERYGKSVSINEIFTLTEKDYSENIPIKIIGDSGKGWNELGMHHLHLFDHNLDCYFFVTDGYTKK